MADTGPERGGRYDYRKFDMIKVAHFFNPNSDGAKSKALTALVKTHDTFVKAVGRIFSAPDKSDGKTSGDAFRDVLPDMIATLKPLWTEVFEAPGMLSRDEQTSFDSVLGFWARKMMEHGLMPEDVPEKPGPLPLCMTI